MDRRTLFKATLTPSGLNALSGSEAGAATGRTASAAVDNSASGPHANGSAATPGALQAQGTLVPIYATDVTNVVARPELILTSYQALAPAASADSVIRSALGAPFTSLAGAGCFATYATVFAGTVAPSGVPSLAAMSASLQQLLTLPALACDHYGKLAMILTLLARPTLIPPDAAAGEPAKPTMHFAAWLDDSPLNIGAHSQLVVSNVLNGAYLLLDAMYSFAIRLPYSGAYPKPTLSVLENAAALLQTPTATGNYVDLWTANAAANRALVVQAMTSGTMGPQFIDNDADSGADAWDLHMASLIDNMA